ncbi:gp185 [Sphingomonas phage PAU]|uniref:nucleotide-sugar epimerase n=1 Tax=Sphingomonas phage PAU TaxID=1150991 RepID=UPI0002573357|nr:nucleotide-sugar epimerase [Sphingomonas phage PAU]AFF28183.1 gp185 [Sphingomonas phage PAU]
MSNIKRSVLVTGALGFIGSNFVRTMAKRYPDYLFIPLDNFGYAANLEHIPVFEKLTNVTKVQEITLGSFDEAENFILASIFKTYDIDTVVHFAAESHVDNSISNPDIFVLANVKGTVDLLNVAKNYWADRKDVIFHHVSTDEVFGALGMEGSFNDDSNYDPHSPYSASKAASDMFVKAYATTYNMLVSISNCSNNFGPYQHKEKLIPKVLDAIKNKTEIPLYGHGQNVRDWLHVLDHNDAIDMIIHHTLKSKESRRTWLIGGGVELTNIELIDRLTESANEHDNTFDYKSLIKFVSDRAGHDLRYSIDSSTLRKELEWKPKYDITKCIPYMIGETLGFTK